MNHCSRFLNSKEIIQSFHLLVTSLNIEGLKYPLKDKTVILETTCYYYYLFLHLLIDCCQSGEEQSLEAKLKKVNEDQDDHLASLRESNQALYALALRKFGREKEYNELMAKWEKCKGNGDPKA